MISQARRIGVLSTLTDPMLPMLLLNLKKEGIDDISVILDSKARSQKDINIWMQRTAGSFDNIEIGIDDFCSSKISFYFTKNHNSPECIALLGSLEIAVLINGGTPRKLSNDVLKVIPHGVVNAHPGLLPNYRGSSCVEWSILDNNPVGHSVHFMTSDYDAGPIIETEVVNVSGLLDYVSIRVKVYSAWAPLLARVTKRVLDEDLYPNCFPAQASGKCFGPINEEQLSSVRAIVSKGLYNPPSGI